MRANTGLPILHVWPRRLFDATGWLKQAMRDRKDKLLTQDAQKPLPRDFTTDLVGDARFSRVHLEDLAVRLARRFVARLCVYVSCL
jgi:hypothetical protein